MSRQSVITSRQATRQTPPLVALTLWVYQRLLLIQPPAFRRDFATSIIQVFRQSCLDAYALAGAVGVVRLWLPAAGDVLSGAFAEYALLIVHILKGQFPMPQYRRSASAIFAAFIAFVIAGIGFQKMSEDVMKSSLPTTYPVLSISYTTMAVGAVVALLAILIGGIPVAVAAFGHALAQRRFDILARFLVPPVALLVLIGYGLVIEHFNLGGHTPDTIHSPARIATIGSFVTLFVICAIASTYAVLSAIARSELNERLVRFTLLPGALAALAMLVMFAAQIAWSLGLWQNAPTHFWGNDGVLATSTLVGTLAQVLVMLVATVIAVRALLRGLAVNRTPPATPSIA